MELKEKIINKLKKGLKAEYYLVASGSTRTKNNKDLTLTIKEAEYLCSLLNDVGQSEQLKPFHCPNCKQPWDTRLTNSCQCGASIKRF